MFLYFAIENLLRLEFVLLSCHNAVVIFTHKSPKSAGFLKKYPVVVLQPCWLVITPPSSLPPPDVMEHKQ